MPLYKYVAKKPRLASRGIIGKRLQPINYVYQSSVFVRLLDGTCFLQPWLLNNTIYLKPECQNLKQGLLFFYFLDGSVTQHRAGNQQNVLCMN